MDCVTNFLVIVRTLVEHLEERGDLAFAQLQNTEHSAQLRSAKRMTNDTGTRLRWKQRSGLFGPREGGMTCMIYAMDLPPSAGRQVTADRWEQGKLKSSLSSDSHEFRHTNLDIAGAESKSTAIDRRREEDLVSDWRPSIADLTLARIDERICALLALRDTHGKDTVIPPTTGISSDAGGDDPPCRGRERPRKFHVELSAPFPSREFDSAMSSMVPVDPTEWVTISRRTRGREDAI